MSTIFISGVAGFLGSHLAEKLHGKGHYVIGCDNLIGGDVSNIPEGIIFHKADCSDLSVMSRITRDVEIIYHCAATAYEGLSVFSPTLITQNIVQASVSLITASIKNGIRRFVNFSSMARYGENEIPFVEDMKPNPQDPYGIGKVTVEQILSNLCSIHGMEFVTVVPHNIIGPRQKYDDPYRNVASIMVNLMLQERQPIIYGNGNQKRCFSFVEDVVGPMEQLAFDKAVTGQIINLGPDDEFITINELAQTIADIIGFKLNPFRVGSRPMEVKLANCSASKARKLLGYEPKVRLHDGLQSIIHYISERGTRPFKYHLEVEIKNEHTPVTWLKQMF